ncbi:MAG TPA: hypothetical protein VF168_05005 [Trueperaceae bacterium]
MKSSRRVRLRPGRALAYGISLPLRLVRAAAAFVGGTTTLLTDTLLPGSVRGSSTYRITLGLFQSFLIEQLAGMRAAGAAPLRDRFVQRKALGNVVELAGLATVRFSPLWVFAIAADATGGGRIYLERLVEHLKRHGVLREDAEPRELVDVLDAVQSASQATASAVDMPPLSRRELEELVAEMRGHYSKVFSDSGALLRHLETTWQEILEVSRRQEVPLERVLGVMALEAASLMRKGIGTVAAVGGASWSVLDEAVISSYRTILGQIASEGIGPYVTKHYHPFLNAARAHFDPQRLTSVERWLGVETGRE